MNSFSPGEGGNTVAGLSTGSQQGVKVRAPGIFGLCLGGKGKKTYDPNKWGGLALLLSPTAQGNNPRGTLNSTKIRGRGQFC